MKQQKINRLGNIKNRVTLTHKSFQMYEEWNNWLKQVISIQKC